VKKDPIQKRIVAAEAGTSPRRRLWKRTWSCTGVSYERFAENADGVHTFTIPIEALDKGIDCAAFSKRKEKWYARTLVARSDSLPISAWKDEALTKAGDLGLTDGEYEVEVALAGGSGRASVQSPAKLKIEGDAATATIIWGSSNYDYMIVDGTRYDPITLEGGSTFEIPVTVFDRPMQVTADTTAMSKPYEIEYTLTFDSKTIKEIEMDSCRSVCGSLSYGLRRAGECRLQRCVRYRAAHGRCRQPGH
jgi:hypothetical protein